MPIDQPAIVENVGGMDFTGLKEDYAQLPEFTSTEEAEAYGRANKHDKAVIRSLHRARNEAVKEFETLFAEYVKTKEKGMANKLAGLALKGQLLREALEAMGDVGASIRCYSEPIKGEIK